MTDQDFPITREDLVPLIGKKVDIQGSHGIIIIDVGQETLYYKWPSQDEIKWILISNIQRVSWDEVTHKFIGKSYVGEKAERVVQS